MEATWKPHLAPSLAPSFQGYRQGNEKLFTVAMQEEIKAEKKDHHDGNVAAADGGASTAGEAAQVAGEVAAFGEADGSQEHAASSTPATALESSGSLTTTTSIFRRSNTVAHKIAAFSSGVAPVKAGMDTSGEDEILVEEVLHKLEAASVVSMA